MKNNFLKILLLTTCIITVNGGCKKFLDQEVPGQLLTDNFYKTDEDALQATTAIYDLLTAHYNNGAWASMYVVKTMLSDESNAGGSGPGDQEGYQKLDDFQIDPNNDKVAGAWSISYGQVFRANQVINLVQGSNPLRTRLIAEAKFLRALSYLDLVSLWGDVPLVTGNLAPAQYTTTPRSKKEDVYAQIVKDLTEAIAVLPSKSTYAASERFRASKGAAQALLGRALLYQQKWSEAAAQLEAVITSGQYSLEPSIGRAFAEAGEFGPESVFEVSYNKNESYNWGNFPWGGRPESNIHVQLMGPRSDYYTKAPADSLIGGWGFNTPKAKLYNAFVTAGDVNRRRQIVMSQAELVAAGGNWSAPNAWDYEGYFQRKYGSFVAQTNSSGSNVAELNYGTNWRLIRYADVLLMAAEAYYRSNNEPKALGYVKQVRLRSQLADINPSGAALFTAIVSERQLELAFEGYRFIDLVRWGLAAQELGTLGYQSKNSLLPIPQQDVQTGRLQQNPGY